MLAKRAKPLQRVFDNINNVGESRSTLTSTRQTNSACIRQTLSVQIETARDLILPLLSLPKPHPGPSTVLDDELDAGVQGAAHSQIICDGHTRMKVGKLSSPDCAQAHGRLPCKIFSAPPEDCSGGSNLKARQGLSMLTHIVTCGTISATTSQRVKWIIEP
jgi:hypothetical protein